MIVRETLKTNIKSRNFKIFSGVTVGIAIATLILALLSPFPVVESKPSSTSYHGKTSNGHSSSGSSNIGSKVVMINFDDGWKSQSTYAKPILDKYGFKATSLYLVPRCKRTQNG